MNIATPDYLTTARAEYAAVTRDHTATAAAILAAEDALHDAELDAAAETSEHCAICNDSEPHTDGRCTACGHRTSIARR